MNHLWGWVNEFAERFELEPELQRSRAYEELRPRIFALKEAIDSDERIQVAEALAELVFECYSVGLAYGIRMDRAVRAVNDSRMSMLGISGKPVKDASGKILPGPRFRTPRMSAALQPPGES